MSRSDQQENALISAAMMLATVIAIVGIVCGYKHCEAADQRIESCLSNGHHTGAECHDAYHQGAL